MMGARPGCRGMGRGRTGDRFSGLSHMEREEGVRGKERGAGGRVHHARVRCGRAACPSIRVVGVASRAGCTCKSEHGERRRAAWVSGRPDASHAEF